MLQSPSILEEMSLQITKKVSCWVAPPFPTLRHHTLAFEKGRAEKHLTKALKREVKRHTKPPGTEFLSHGVTDDSDVGSFVPRRKPYDIFKAAPCEQYGRATQVLTGHGYIGQYYHRFQLPDTTPWCPRSHPGTPIFQTREHLLKECSLFSTHHHILTDADAYMDDPGWKVGRFGEPTHRFPELIHFLVYRARLLRWQLRSIFPFSQISPQCGVRNRPTNDPLLFHFLLT